MRGTYIPQRGATRGGGSRKGTGRGNQGLVDTTSARVRYHINDAVERKGRERGTEISWQGWSRTRRDPRGRVCRPQFVVRYQSRHTRGTKSPKLFRNRECGVTRVGKGCQRRLRAGPSAVRRQRTWISLDTYSMIIIDITTSGQGDYMTTDAKVDHAGGVTIGVLRQSPVLSSLRPLLTHTTF